MSAAAHRENARWDETEQKVVVFGVEGVEGVIGVRCLLQNNNKKKMPHVNGAKQHLTTGSGTTFQ